MAILSKEELQRIRDEEDAEPYFPGFTYGEFQKLPEHRQMHENQKFFQFATSSLGYWKTCSLSPCRRAKSCKGFLSKVQAATGLQNFPPCIREGAYRQEATLKETHRLLDAPDEEGPLSQKRR